MSKRNNYYKHQKANDTEPFEAKSKYNHDGRTIPVTTTQELEALAMDYLSVRRAGTYYEAFECVLKVIAVMKIQARTIEEYEKNFTV